MLLDRACLTRGLGNRVYSMLIDSLSNINFHDSELVNVINVISELEVAAFDNTGPFALPRSADFRAF
jgi:hypothetical protein